MPELYHNSAELITLRRCETAGKNNQEAEKPPGSGFAWLIFSIYKTQKA